MYKLTSLILMLSATFGYTLVYAQNAPNFAFQPKPAATQPSSSSREVLTPDQFRNKVQTESTQNRRELLDAANKNAKPLTGFPKIVKPANNTQQQPQTTNTASQPMPQTVQQPTQSYPTEEAATQNPVSKPPPVIQKPAKPTQSAPIYTGFPSGGSSGTGGKSSNTGSGSSGGGWNIQY
jgi:hypothetical protein